MVLYTCINVIPDQPTPANILQQLRPCHICQMKTGILIHSPCHHRNIPCAVGDRGTFSILQGSPLQRTDVSKYHLLSDVSHAHWADSNIAITGEGESTTDSGKTWRKASFPTRLGRDCFPLLNKNGLAFVATSRYSHQYPNPSTYHIDLVLSRVFGRSHGRPGLLWRITSLLTLQL